MVKIFGSILVCLATCGIADAYYENLKKRYEEYHIMEELIAYFASEIGTCRNTLPEAMVRIAGKVPEPFSNMLAAVRKEMMKNTEYRFHVI